jgi:hypothetical protein
MTSVEKLGEMLRNALKEVYVKAADLRVQPELTVEEDKVVQEIMEGALLSFRSTNDILRERSAERARDTKG